MKYTRFQAYEMAAKGTPMHAGVGSESYFKLYGDALHWFDKETNEKYGKVEIICFTVSDKCEWEPYIKTPQLTDDEKVILRNIETEFKWIARDKDGNLCVCDEYPNICGERWLSNEYAGVEAFCHLFKTITWEIGVPLLIEDLLK